VTVYGPPRTDAVVREGRDGHLVPDGWVVVAAAAGVTMLGWAAGLAAVFAAGAAALVLAAIVVLPEALVAVFLAAGVLKAHPLLAAIPGDLTLLSGICVALAMLLRIIRDGVPSVPRAAALYPALVVLMLVGVLWSPDPEKGFGKAQVFETLTLLSFACPFVLFRTRVEVQRLMAAVVAIGLFLSLTAVRTVHEAAPLIAAGSNEIELALYAAWGMLAAVGYLFVVGTSPWRVLWLIPGALLGVTVIQAGSRSVLLGAALGLAFLTVQMLSAPVRGRVGFLAVVGASAVAALLVGTRLAGGATSKYTHYLFHADLNSILIGREWILSRGWELALGHPMGLGTGAFQWATGWEQSHNMFFELSSEQGIAGVALALALIWAAWRTRLSGPGGRSPEALICGALTLLFLVLALFVNGPNDSRPLWFTLGLSLALPHLRRAAPPQAVETTAAPPRAAPRTRRALSLS
jgi:hypothetical protein